MTDGAMPPALDQTAVLKAFHRCGRSGGAARAPCAPLLPAVPPCRCGSHGSGNPLRQCFSLQATKNTVASHRPGGKGPVSSDVGRLGGPLPGTWRSVGSVRRLRMLPHRSRTAGSLALPALLLRTLHAAHHSGSAAAGTRGGRLCLCDRRAHACRQVRLLFGLALAAVWQVPGVAVVA